jgi:hypothetical protein
MMTSNKKNTTRRPITTSNMMETGRVRFDPTVPLHARTDRSKEVAMRTIKMPGADEMSPRLAIRAPFIKLAFAPNEDLATAR